MRIDEVLVEKELGVFDERHRKRILYTCGCLEEIATMPIFQLKRVYMKDRKVFAITL